MKHIVDVEKFNIVIDRKKQLQKQCHGYEIHHKYEKQQKL